MSYIEKSLSEEEEIIKVGEISVWIYVPVVGFWGVSALLSGFISLYFNTKPDSSFMFISLLIIAITCLLIAFYNYLRFKCIEMSVTNKRLVFKHGIIAEDVQELRLEKVESVSVKKSILGTILGYGDIIFTGTGDTSLIFRNISDPSGIKNEVDKAFDKKNQDDKG